jgi:hypothetical protein
MSLDQSTGKHNTASYSNLCDHPLYTGYTTLGGEHYKQNGVRGIYIHEFPSYTGSVPPSDYHLVNYSTNKTGWAWWAGTSFATPIISGLLAAAWGKNWLGANGPYEFLNSSSSSNVTKMDEKVIVVTQP